MIHMDMQLQQVKNVGIFPSDRYMFRVGACVVCDRGMVSEFKNGLVHLGKSPRLNWEEDDC